MAQGRWELVGRDEELALAVAELTVADRAGVVVLGPAGVGKSRLADEVVGALDPTWSVQRVAGTPSATDIPFGAFAHLLDDPVAEDGPAPRRLEPPDLLWTLRRLRQRLLAAADGAPLLVAVDDAHALDEASATLVLQLAVLDEARVLVTVRSAEPCPDPVVALWRDEHCTRLDLQALSTDEVGRLTAHALGRWPTQDTRDRLAAASGGNPLLLRELLADAEVSDALHVRRGLVHWDGVTGTPRLRSLVASALGRLDADAADVVDLLAVGEPIPEDVIRSLAPLPTLAELEQAGVITVGRLADRQVRLVHPLYGEVRRSGLGALQRSLLGRRLADALEAAGHDHPDDELRIVRWRLDAGEHVDGAVLARAAESARAGGDGTLARTLVDAARRSGSTPALDLLAAELAELDGRSAEAAGLLAGLGPRLDGDDARARALTAEIRVLAHALGWPDEAEGVAARADLIADPTWRAFVQAQWATTLSMLGRFDEARPLAAELFAGDDDRVRLRVLPAVNLAALAAGRLEEGRAAAMAMIGPALARRDEVPVGTALVFSALSLDLLQLGRLDELDALLGVAAADPSSALPANRECVERFERADPQGYLAAATAVLAEARALAGDRAGAVAAAQESARLAAAGAERLIDVDSARCRAWAPVADGDPATAKRELADVARSARDAGLPALELAALHDAVRLGAGRRTIRRLVTVADTVDGARAEAMARHGRALLAERPDEVEAASEAFEALGELLTAGELAAEAARGHAERGRPQAARRAGVRAEGLLARCEGAQRRIPAIDLGPALTPRELQVARLAAAGRTSRAIADELDVSTRTVDNQLSRTYAKLGIGGRGDLAAALEALGAAAE